MNKEQLKSVLEALIFASDTPLTIHQMVMVLENFEKAEIEEALTQIQESLADRAFFLKKVSGGYQFATRPEYSRWIKKMYHGKEKNRLTRAALESLAIIAFKQPVSRVEVTAIRGVNSDAVIKGLLERKLITISGRGEGQGRALLFITTPQFLQYFGINDIADLPKPKEIEELLAAGEAARIMSELEEASMQKEEAEANALEATAAKEEGALLPGAEEALIDLAVSEQTPALDERPVQESGIEGRVPEDMELSAAATGDCDEPPAAEAASESSLSNEALPEDDAH